MANYRVYHLGDDDHISGVHNLECNDDDAAFIQAQLLDVICVALEVWEGGRFVGRVAPTSPGGAI
jgi:hypothetical protein